MSMLNNKNYTIIITNKEVADNMNYVCIIRNYV
jgi:hypothetical protein